MNREEIMTGVRDVFRENLENDSLTLTGATTAADVEGWDSLMHLQLIVALENFFNIKFSSREILAWKNVGEMVDAIARRLERGRGEV